jgi:hypothetical protein
MTLLAATIALVGTWLVGAGLASMALRGAWRAVPGGRALLAGCAYPLGALAVVAWLYALALLRIPASTTLAVAPVALAALVAAWRVVQRARAGDWRVWRAAASGSHLSPGERWIWRALVGWLALRALLLAVEIVSRPPLPWEAWLHAAGRGHLWLALRGPATFVPEPFWWNGGGYLAALSSASLLTPALDAWTSFALGGFDDTLIHAPWLAFWLSQLFIVYGALRSVGAAALHAFVGAAFVGTLPMANAHAALGGTAVLPLSTHYLALAVFAWRFARTRAPGDGAIAVAMTAGAIVAGGASALLWLTTLLPLAVTRASVQTMRKTIGAMLVAAILVAIAVAQNRLFAPAGLQDVPSPGLAALFQHAFLLGNWHLLPYAAAACAILGVRAWSDRERLPLTGVVALGAVAVIALSATSAGYRLLGPIGVIAQSSLTFAPLLGLWTAWVAHAAWQETRADAPVAHTGAAPAPTATSDATTAIPGS